MSCTVLYECMIVCMYICMYTCMYDSYECTHECAPYVVCPLPVYECTCMNVVPVVCVQMKNIDT
jgi:hypothetical protein